MSPRRDRVALAARLRRTARRLASAGEQMQAQRAMTLAEAAQWLAAPLDDRDIIGIRMALSDARFWRRHIMRRQRNEVLA